MDGLAIQAGMAAGGIDPLKNGYYFFDPEDLSAGNVTSWDGSLPESDNSLYLTATQSTGPDQPIADGLARVIFADNTDHFDIPSTSQSGWQIVGTSLGTFAYRVDADAITELNLLGNLGRAAFRQAGDLYGIILLPDTATPAQVEAARQLLISRGAADGTTASNYFAAWYNRDDIVDFSNVDFTSAINMQSAFQLSYALSSFNVAELPAAWNLKNTWRECTSLTSFSTKIPSALDCAYAWQFCTSLTDFSEDVFANWNPSSLTSGIFNLTWALCTSLTPQSVENILVSIAASGKYATTSGASGGTALNDPEIDIDYDGSGLTAATTTAITTLKSRGWGIVINGNLQ